MFQAFPAVDWPSRINLMVVSRLRGAKEGIWGHTERSFELKARIGALLKTTLAKMQNGGDSGCTFLSQLCLS